MSEPVLAALDLDKEMRVEADASDYVTGRVLSMKCEDERWRLVVYISKSLSNTEKNYEIYNKEMLAVIRCLEAWRHFLEGARIKFEVWMDHKNLDIINRSFLLSHFHYSFPFNFFFCSIYSMGKYMSHHVTEGVTPSHQRSRHMSRHTSFGWERGILGAQTIRNVYK